MKDIPEVKIKHLEMIQSVITRLSANSFMLKGWAVTLVAGILALSIKDNPIYLIVSYIPVILFWFLDSYYLYLEKRYRALYNRIRMLEEADPTFELHPDSFVNAKFTYIKCIFSKTEFFFYFPIASFVLVIICIIKYL